MKGKENVTLGGIVKKLDGGYGFSVTFDTVKEARKYKDMFKWIIESDEYKVKLEHAGYDREV